MVKITKEHLDELREHQQKNYYGSITTYLYIGGI
jgi:hypothetical protein